MNNDKDQSSASFFSLIAVIIIMLLALYAIINAEFLTIRTAPAENEAYSKTTTSATYTVIKLLGNDSDNCMMVADTGDNETICFSIPQCVYALLEENDKITLTKTTITTTCDNQSTYRYTYNSRELFAMEQANNINRKDSETTTAATDTCG